MKKSFFQTRGNLLAAMLVIAIALASVFPSTALAATNYPHYTPSGTYSNYNDYYRYWYDDSDYNWWKYWYDADDEYWDYWEDCYDDDDWDWDDWDDARADKNTKKYLSLKGSNYFTDVKGSRYGKYVNWCAKHGLLRKIAKKGKAFHPDKIMTKKELRQMLKNGYGSELSMKVGSSKAGVTQKYFCRLTAKAAKQLDYKLGWTDISNAKMDRGMVCYCMYQMIKTSKGAMYTID